MKTNYAPTTLDQYLNESKSITLKRGYGERQPVVVGVNAPIRNQILSFVAENLRVAKGELKRFIAGLNEGSRNPNASAIMWLKRNAQFFVTESRDGQTFFKLSPVGKRLADRFVQLPSSVLTEKKKENKDDYDFVDTKKGYPRKGIYDVSEEDEEKCKKCGKVKCECSESVTETRKARIEAIIERIKTKRVQELSEEKQLMGKDPLAKTAKTGSKLGGKLEKNLHNQLEPGQDKDENELSKFPEEKGKKKINEAEEEKKEEEDELSFDDLDLGDEEESKEEKPEGEGEEKEEKPEGEEVEEDEKVEITEFIITVTNADEAIKELDELGVPAEKVEDEEEEEEKEEPEEESKEEKPEDKGEPAEKPAETGGLDLGEAAEGEEKPEGETPAPEGTEPEIKEEEPAAEEKIKVSVDYWEKLKGWLEKKGVDVEEMFGGEIEVEDDTEEKPEEGEGEEGTDDFDLDLGDGEEGGEGEGTDDFSLDLEEGGSDIVNEPAQTLGDKIADKIAQKIVDKM
jgi:hypothetical protein